MLALGAGDSIDAGSTNASTVNCTIFGLLLNAASPPVAQGYDVLAQAQLGSSVASVYAPGSNTALVKNIHLYNTGTSTQTVTVAVNGTAGSNTIATLNIPAKGWATYVDGTGWQIFTAVGLPFGSSGSPGGVGTPDAAAVSLTAGSANVVTGTKFQLATGSLYVGQRFRFELVVTKTAAGTATWTMTVKYGTAGTTSDAAIATWTSGTNTAAIDKATIGIEVVILTLGASATAACTAMYVNRLTDATGLGDIAIAPGSTATFDSTAASPFLHVDITPGASAVMTAAGSAERLV